MVWTPKIFKCTFIWTHITKLKLYPYFGLVFLSYNNLRCLAITLALFVSKTGIPIYIYCSLGQSPRCSDVNSSYRGVSIFAITLGLHVHALCYRLNAIVYFLKRKYHEKTTLFQKVVLSV